MKKLSTEEFIKKSKEKYGDKFDYSKVIYKGTHDKICLICKKHGEFYITPHNHMLKNGGCIKCQHENQKYDSEELIEKFKKIHNLKYRYDKVVYNGIDKQILVVCPIHGDFLTTPHNHLKGCGCPKCAKNQTLTIEEFVKRSNNIHKNFYDYSDSRYINSHTKIEIKCPEHGTFLQFPYVHLMGCGCSICKKSSKMEIKVSEILDNLKIKYDYQKKFSWLGLQSIDFYLPDYKIGIECQGEQHFKPIRFGGITEQKAKERYLLQLTRDKRKKELCDNNNVKLIYYTDFNKKNEYGMIVGYENLIKEINNICSNKMYDNNKKED